ncbi:MAG: CPBP family intramembrane glutamic endopeptidase [Candidatus Babeliales bacterium]|jgi:membrane protease YdiL (CAAX protease family)
MNTSASLLERLSAYVGPIALSAFSLFLTFHIVQPLALWLDPTFTLLANRGVGKIAFTIAVIVHILLLLSTVSRNFMRQFFATNVLFLRNVQWLKTFFGFLTLFSLLHSSVIALAVVIGAAEFHPELLALIPSKCGSLLWGLVVTFFLAWTEELIFRGTLYPFFRQGMSTIASALLTSTIFMFVHNITNPLDMVTTNWRLGLGLFLLGLMLNLVFALTGKLYVGMGMHAGVVFVKVFLRRIPCVTYIGTLPWWLNADLRQAPLVHALFGLVVICLLVMITKKRQSLSSH